MRKKDLKNSKSKYSEQTLVKKCINYLNSLGYLVQRNNSGMIFLKGNRGIRAIRMGIKGAPDIVGLTPDGRFIGIECKIEDGKLTEIQKKVGLDISKRGGIYLVIYSIDDLKKFLNGDNIGKIKENNI